MSSQFLILVLLGFTNPLQRIVDQIVVPINVKTIEYPYVQASLLKLFYQCNFCSGVLQMHANKYQQKRKRNPSKFFQILPSAFVCLYTRWVSTTSANSRLNKRLNIRNNKELKFSIG